MKPIFTVGLVPWAAAGTAASSAAVAAPISVVLMVSFPLFVRSASAQLHEDVVALELDRVDRDVLRHRCAQRLAGLDLEAPGVQRTLDDAVLEIAVGQAGIGVRADVVGRQHLAADPLDR